MILWLLACVQGPGDAALLPYADRALFLEAEPILGASCANPSCHGDASRPLEVFAPHRHRLDPSQTHSDAPLTAEERSRNFDRVRAFLVDVDVPENCALLYEPLARPAGGAAHGGSIVVFEDATDPDYQVLYTFVDDALRGAP